MYIYIIKEGRRPSSTSFPPLLFAFAFASVSCRWIPTSATMRRRYIFDQIDPPLIHVASPPKFFIHRLLVRF